jgi:putative phosphoribosyl transferase
VVLGLPRGGVPVAAPVAIALATPLSVLYVRKISVPQQPDTVLGAVAERDVVVIDEEVAARAGLTSQDVERVVAREQASLNLDLTHSNHRPAVPLTGRTALIIDDGVTTGTTARAGCLSARRAGAAAVVLAVPVAPPGWALPMHDVADDVVALHVPTEFRALDEAYADFSPTTDDDVFRALTDANA